LFFILLDDQFHVFGYRSLRARAVTIVDALGNTRLMLSATKQDTMVSMYDPSGQPGMLVGSTAGRYAMSIFEADSRMRISLGLVGGDATLHLMDGTGKGRAEMSCCADAPGGSVSFSDEDGRVIARIPSPVGPNATE
jgi:hypothetical protein